MNNSLIEIFDRFYFNEESIEMVIFELRKAGATQMESVKILKSKLNISLSEADDLILNSDSWKDLKNINLINRQDFIDNLNNEK